MLSEHATSTPIFWGHGLDDPLVKYEICEKSVTFLRDECKFRKLGDNDKDIAGLRCKAYAGMEHSSCPKEMDDLRSWLKSAIPKEGGRL
jgi:predicted esterase